MDPRPDLSQAAVYWDDLTDQYFKDGVVRRAEWQMHPAAVARRSQLFGARDARGWLTERLPGRVDRALGAGCGTASFELGLLAGGFVGHYDLCDVSGSSLDAATGRAKELGVEDRITIRQGDMLGADRDDYGLVTFVSSLHHAVDVGAAVRFAHRVLNPNGLLYADEYIGPRRFGYPPQHSDLVKALYRSLAPELRGPWPELPQPDPVDVAAADPTEATESDLIVDALRAQFAEVVLAPIFGALPFMLWWGLDHDALWDTQQGRDFVEILLALDTAMGVSGALPPYFSLILARRS